MIVGVLPMSVFAVEANSATECSDGNHSYDNVCDTGCSACEYTRTLIPSESKYWKPIYELTNEAGTVYDNFPSFSGRGTRVIFYDTTTITKIQGGLKLNNVPEGYTASNSSFRFDNQTFTGPSSTINHGGKKNQAGLDFVISLDIKADVVSDATMDCPIRLDMQKANVRPNVLIRRGNDVFMNDGVTKIATISTDKFTNISVLVDNGGATAETCANTIYYFVDGVCKGSSRFLTDAEKQIVYECSATNYPDNHPGFVITYVEFHFEDYAQSGFTLKSFNGYYFDETPDDNNVGNASRGSIEYAIPHTPNADDGDCRTPITCSVCGEVVPGGEAAHNFGGADLSVVKEATCSSCGVIGTRYGNIPADKADATANPVVLFDKDGNYVTSGDFLTVFAASLKTSETTVENPDNDPVYIVFRSGADFRMDNNATAQNLTNKYGNIVIDLMGNGISAGNGGEFWFILGGTNANDLSITVKNGTIYNKFQPQVGIGSSATLTVDKVVNLTFEDITVNKQRANETGFLKVTGYAGTGKLTTNVVMNDCIFIPSTGNLLFGLAADGNGAVNLTVNGGVINAASFDAIPSIYTAGANDTVKFGKGSDGKYTKIVFSAAQATPGNVATLIYDTVSEGKALFVTDENATEYVLTPCAHDYKGACDTLCSICGDTRPTVPSDSKYWTPIFSIGSKGAYSSSFTPTYASGTSSYKVDYINDPEKNIELDQNNGLLFKHISNPTGNYARTYITFNAAGLGDAANTVANGGKKDLAGLDFVFSMDITAEVESQATSDEPIYIRMNGDSSVNSFITIANRKGNTFYKPNGTELFTLEVGKSTNVTFLVDVGGATAETSGNTVYYFVDGVCIGSSAIFTPEQLTAIYDYSKANYPDNEPGFILSAARIYFRDCQYSGFTISQLSLRYLDDTPDDNNVTNAKRGANIFSMPHTPEEDDGDCRTPILCTVCGEVAGESAHTPGTKATCVSKATCATCGQEFGEYGDHDYSEYGENDLYHWVTCSACGVPEDGVKTKHVYDNAYDNDCNVCGYENKNCISESKYWAPIYKLSESNQDANSTYAPGFLPSELTDIKTNIQAINNSSGAITLPSGKDKTIYFRHDKSNTATNAYLSIWAPHNSGKFWRTRDLGTQNLAGLDFVISMDIMAEVRSTGTANNPIEISMRVRDGGTQNRNATVAIRKGNTYYTPDGRTEIFTLEVGVKTNFSILVDVGGETAATCANSVYYFVDGQYVGSYDGVYDSEALADIYNVSAASWADNAPGFILTYAVMYHTDPAQSGFKISELGLYYFDDTPDDGEIRNSSRGSAEYDELAAHRYSIRKSNDTEHWMECICGAIDESTREAHDGEATCVSGAICSVCGKEYGEINPDNHAGDTENEWIVENGIHHQICDCGEIINQGQCDGGDAITDITCVKCGTPITVDGFYERNEHFYIDGVPQFAQGIYTDNNGVSYYVNETGKVLKNGKVELGGKTYDATNYVLTMRTGYVEKEGLYWNDGKVVDDGIHDVNGVEMYFVDGKLGTAEVMMSDGTVHKFVDGVRVPEADGTIEDKAPLNITIILKYKNETDPIGKREFYQYWNQPFSYKAPHHGCYSISFDIQGANATEEGDTINIANVTQDCVIVVTYDTTVAVHEYETEPYKIDAPTCSAQGTKYFKCVYCGAGSATDKTESIDIVPDAHNYNYEGGIVTVGATCILNGSTTYKCEYCEYSYTVYTAKTAHTWVVDSENSKAPSCVDGYTAYKCDCEGCTATKKVKVPATDEHQYVAYGYKAATCCANGYNKEMCTVCGSVKTTVLPANGIHVYGKYDTPNEVLEKSNGDRVLIYNCSECGKINAVSVVVAAPAPILAGKDDE